jgi:DNA repair exonuclease SbcCD ATPase subunit
MIIERIEIKNWLAFRGEHILDPVPTGAISVVARYDDNPRRSNWAGKTAFLESIEWALFGVHRKRYEDEVIFTGEDEVSVHLVFTDDFHVIRSRKRGKATRLVVVQDGLEYEKKPAEELVKTRLGFDAIDFRATVCFAQGDTEAIVERTSGERRKVIGQWLELDAWARIGARARAHLKKLADFYQERRGSIGAIEESLIEEVHAIVSEEEVQGWLEEGEEGPTLAIRGWIDSDTPQELFFETRKASDEIALKIARSALEGVETKLQGFAGIESAESAHRQRELFIEEGKRLREELKGAGVAGLEEANEAFSRASGSVESARTEVREAEELCRGNFDGVCPVTRAACSVADEVRANREAAQTRLETARGELIERQAKKEEKRRELNLLAQEERTLQGKRERFKLVVAEVKRLEPLSRKWIESDRPSPAEIQKLKADQVEYHRRVIELESAIRTVEDKVGRIHSERTRLKKIRDSLDGLERDVRIANLAVKATSQTGIPAYIAEAILVKLEERANVLLAGSGLSFAFSLDRETKDLAPTCFECGYVYRGRKDKACPACQTERGMKRADELEILVEDGSGTLEDVKTKSGGAKVLVGSAIRLAAGLMLRELRGSSCAFAMVDEPFGALDAENRAALAGTFSSMLGAVGLEQAFVVSHDTALLDALASRVLISRHRDHSSIEVIS